MTALKISDEFQGETVTISEEEIEAFCRVVGNEGESYKANVKGGMQVPMDFAIKLGWKVRRRPRDERLAAELTIHTLSTVHHEANLPFNHRW